MSLLGRIFDALTRYRPELEDLHHWSTEHTRRAIGAQPGFNPANRSQLRPDYSRLPPVVPPGPADLQGWPPER